MAVGLLGNRYLLFGLAFELVAILLIIYTPPGQWLFGTAPIDAEVWLLALACALLMWLLDEAVKGWRRHALR